MAPPRRKTNFSNVEIEQMLSQVRLSTRRPPSSLPFGTSSSPIPLLLLLCSSDHSGRNSHIELFLIFSRSTAHARYAGELRTSRSHHPSTSRARARGRLPQEFRKVRGGQGGRDREDMRGELPGESLGNGRDACFSDGGSQGGKGRRCELAEMSWIPSDPRSSLLLPGLCLFGIDASYS